ncbi:metal-dependent transcriptional regulator [Arthrobacter russicus]|jgi:DtxR family Mn-dependent transcriptional regulator
MMPRPAVTRMVEDYVTLIWKAYEWPGGQPTTTDLAAQLGVTASTVSANLKKLARDEYIRYEPYGRIELTDTGRSVAVEIVRRHRILETYLHQHLGLAWDQVHAEADQLEHALSDLVLERMDAAIGHPSHDPHGDPIPDADGRIVTAHSGLLADAAPGTEVVVVRVSDRSPDILRYLDERGITIGAVLQVAAVNTAAASIALHSGQGPIEISLSAAKAVRVDRRN